MAASGETSKYDLPFPLPNDVVDVAGDIELLAVKIDSTIDEIVQDVVGAMVTANTENGIEVTYNDSTGKLNFNVDADPLPDQTGNTGKFLTTDGTDTSWATISATVSAHASSHASGGSDAITIAQSQVTDLVDDLGAKAAANHNHNQSEVTNLTTDLAGKASITHTHAQSDITNLSTDLAAKAPINNPTFTGTVSGTPADATVTTAATGIGFMGIPQSSAAGTTGSYTIQASDAGEHIYASATRTVTIPANSSVALPVGTTIVFISGPTATMTISINTDNLVLVGAGNTGTRTLASSGMATAIKVGSNTWYISGVGLT